VRPASRARPLFAAAIVAAAIVAGCGGGGEDPAEPLAAGAAQARDIQAFASLQQALVAANLVRAEAGGSFGANAGDLARRLKERDASKQFVTTASTGPEVIQVLGGGTGPAMLVVLSPSNAYVAAWTDGSQTGFYRGEQPPAFSATQPEGAGWGDSPPT
jgi:hypothetical protein